VGFTQGLVENEIFAGFLLKDFMEMKSYGFFSWAPFKFFFKRFYSRAL